MTDTEIVYKQCAKGAKLAPRTMLPRVEVVKLLRAQRQRMRRKVRRLANKMPVSFDRRVIAYLEACDDILQAWGEDK